MSILVILLHCFAADGVQTITPVSENELKAEYISKMIEFIDWPGDLFEQGTSPLVIGFFKADSLYNQTLRTMKRVQLQDRPIEVSQVSSLEEMKKCHVIFLGEMSRGELKTYIKELEALPILTLGDSKEFAIHGVMLNFFVNNDYLKFEANMDKIKSNPLHFNPKLLMLAVKVDPDRGR